MKVILVCNYQPDGQQSMLRFGDLLAQSLAARGIEITVVAPRPRLGARFRRAAAGRSGRWLGYFDKYLLFPHDLRRALRPFAHRRDTVVHVVDHSNAIYLPTGATLPWVVTCHDLLAVRGALGEDTDCPASILGRLLQRQITQGLARADALACSSTSTSEDVKRLIHPTGKQERRVILLALNQPYRPSNHEELLPAFASGQPFLLHVGSNLTRKNKTGVLRVFLRLAASGWPGRLVFCGDELPAEISAGAKSAGLTARVHAVPRASEAELEALYSRAHALLFPSRGEGFGWPVIEAQACDCPVICSDRTSLPEVGGDAALVHALDDEVGMAASVLKLGEPLFRTAVIQRGRENLVRFSKERMLDAYIELYASALRSHSAHP